MFRSILYDCSTKFAGPKCAFAARGLSTERTIDSSPIVFENVDLNICNGYNATTGEHQMYVGKIMKVQESSPVADQSTKYQLTCIPGTHHVTCNFPPSPNPPRCQNN